MPRSDVLLVRTDIDSFVKCCLFMFRLMTSTQRALFPPWELKCQWAWAATDTTISAFVCSEPRPRTPHASSYTQRVKWENIQTFLSSIWTSWWRILLRARWWFVKSRTEGKSKKEEHPWNQTLRCPFSRSRAFVQGTCACKLACTALRMRSCSVMFRSSFSTAKGINIKVHQ